MAGDDAERHLGINPPEETFITCCHNNVHPHKGLFWGATPAFTVPPHSPLGPTWIEEKKGGKKKKKGTQATETLAQVVFWYKRGHSGPAALLVSMVTDSCFGGKRSERGRMPRETGQVYITPCNKGYGEIVKHSCLAGGAA